MRAWLFQDTRQKAKLGEDKCPWSVGWLNSEGKRRSKKIGSKSMAEKFRRKKEGELAAGIVTNDSNKTWADFRKEYEEKITPGMEPGSRRETLLCMKHFERLVSPKRMKAIKTATVDGYIAKRRVEGGRKAKSTVSPATVNKELRHLKVVLRVAHDWGYLAVVPRFRMLKEPQKLPTYVTPEDFAAIYEACDKAVRPADQPYSAADWWKALLVFTYMTGWRVSEPLALRWDDLSLDKGTAITRYGDNKGRRDDVASLHPVVVEHLRRIADGAIDCPLVFYWPHHERTLWLDFHAIQETAGVHLPCRENHIHTPACHVYGFHDLRREIAHPQRAEAHPRRPTGPHEAQELLDHETLRQHGPADRRRGRQALRPGLPAKRRLSVYCVSGPPGTKTAPRRLAVSRCGAVLCSSEAVGARTPDLRIKSPLLYQLSYSL